MACVREAMGLIIILLSLFGNDRNGRTLAKSRRLATHLELLELTPVKVFCISKKASLEQWRLGNHWCQDPALKSLRRLRTRAQLRIGIWGSLPSRRMLASLCLWPSLLPERFVCANSPPRFKKALLSLCRRDLYNSSPLKCK